MADIRYSASEVFQFAIRIEENGERFYRRLAGLTADLPVKETFAYLAEQEGEHRRLFEKMLSEIDNYQPEELYPDDYFTYLRSFADNIVFTGRTEEELPAKLDPLKAINFAIRRELDSIMYYLETKPLVPQAQQKMVDRIISEERKHFLQLSDIRQNLQKETKNG